MTIMTFYNINAHVVIFGDLWFWHHHFSKFLAGGYTFSCINPMLNFLKLRHVSHREQW